MLDLALKLTFIDSKDDSRLPGSRFEKQALDRVSHQRRSRFGREFLHHRRPMCFDGLDAQIEDPAHLLVAVPLANEPNDRAFSRRQRRPSAFRIMIGAVLDPPSGYRATSKLLVSDGSFDRGRDELLWFGFQYDCPCAAMKALVRKAVAVVQGENDDLDLRSVSFHLACDLETVDQRERIVEDCDIGLFPQDQLQRLLAVFCLRYDFEVGSPFKDGADSVSNDFMIIRNQYSLRFGVDYIGPGETCGRSPLSRCPTHCVEIEAATYQVNEFLVPEKTGCVTRR